jgi:hypothetical protein
VSANHVYLIGGTIFLMLVAVVVIAARYLSRP